MWQSRHVRAISDLERRRRLAHRHLLTPSRRVDDVAAVADAVVALHSSDPTSVFLSAAARMHDADIPAIEEALYAGRSLVRHHAMRRTIWAMTPAVAQAANAGFSRKIAAAERRRTATLFGEDERWVSEGIDRVAAIVERSGGPISTREVAAQVPDLAGPRVVNAGRSGEGTMAPHTRLLLCAALEGRITRGRPAGTWIGSHYEWWPSAEWHGIDWNEPDPDTGAEEIVRRYLDSFGPVTLEDVVWWTGGTTTLVRRAFDAVDAREVALDDGGTGYVRAGDAGETDVAPWVALLPGLDPTSMGWKRRDWYLPPDLARRVTDRSGNIGPTIWVDGQVVGGWAQRRDGEIVHDAAVPSSHGALLVAEIARLQSFVGETRFSARFPAPNQRDLLA